jgi:hypothetical protein
LPDKGSKDQTLKPMDAGKVWLAPLFGKEAVPAAEFKGNSDEAVWLPNEGVAKARMEPGNVDLLRYAPNGAA